jgi:selenium metabolism protein YedF
MKNLDCRGLSCPGPVIQVKKTLEEVADGESFSIDLDSQSSRDNVRRFAESRGAGVEVGEGVDGAVRLIITAPLSTDVKRQTVSGAKGEGREKLRIKDPGFGTVKLPVILITGDAIGDGDKKLGRILMEGFINALPEQEHVPDRILFMNTGIHLTVQGSPVLGTLSRLTDMGCEILVCGTCLDFFSLKDSLAVGTVSNMYDIQSAMLEADSVINI